MKPEGTATDDLLRPFDEREREAVLDGVMARLGKGATPASPQPVVDPPLVDLQERRSPRPSIVVLAVALAAAAALVLWFVMQPPSPAPGSEVASLPKYAFTELRGGIAKTRSGDETPAEVQLRADETIDWVVTPAAPVRSEVELALLAEPDEGEARLVPLPDVRVSKSGAVRIEGRLSDFVELTPGGWTLSVLITAPGELPETVEEARGAPEGRWRVARARAIIVPP
jgi:hypothetical protein